MKKYNLNLVLLRKALKFRRDGVKLGIKHLSIKAIWGINEYYNYDFKYFRYNKINNEESS